ncbi:MAG TPA: TaqI-like C-terminal specificity domain-containing protein [bacterium]|nr:TaqI-like C-terminal specificity domain-containing protein [bacterium]
MDKRKKLLKLFNDVRSFCGESGIATDPYTFLLNRFYFTVSGKRLSPSLLTGISADDFVKINNRFSDRLKREVVSSWSISYILSLPNPTPMEATPRTSLSRHDILFLSDAVYLPYHLEKEHALHFAYHDEGSFHSPFAAVLCYPLSKEKPVEISVQATIFDMLSADQSKIKPYRFDLILDEAIASTLPQEGFFKNISLLLHEEGSYLLHLKKNFLVSPATKKTKKFLYDLFALREITKDKQKLVLHLGRKRPPEVERPITITDSVNGSFFTVPDDFITFNNLLTFNDSLAYDEIRLLQKIESIAEGNICADHFDFFIGMFPEQGVRPPIETLRKSTRYKPFIRGREIVPFTEPNPNAWIIPDKEFFFQLPASAQFERHKLIARYLSVRPVMCIDRGGLHFMSDIAGIIPKSDDISLEFAEGYFNSSVMLFYYTLKFPHHNKFLKKNFNSIPFAPAKKHVQRIIAQSVENMRHLLCSPENAKKDITAQIERERRNLDRDMYQHFRLTHDDIRIIEQALDRYRS